MNVRTEAIGVPCQRSWHHAIPTANSPGMFLLHFVNDGLQASVLTVLPLIAASLMLSESDVGLLTSAHFAMGILLAIPATTLLRRASGEFLLAVAMALVGICLLGIAMTSHISWFWGVFLTAGVAFGVFHPIAFAVLTQRATSTNRSSVMGWFTASGDIGRVVISSVFLLSATLCGWRGASFVTGAIALIAAMVLLNRKRVETNFVSRSEPSKTGANDRRVNSSLGGRLLCNHAFIRTTCVGSLDALGNAGLIIFLPFALLDAGISATMLPLLTGLFFASSIAGKVIMGLLADRVGSLRAIAICQTTNVAAIACLLMADNQFLLAMAVTVLGSTNKGSLPAILSETSRCVESTRTHRAVGINQLALGIATTLSPLLYGLASHWTDARTACATAVVTSLAALLLCRDQE